MDITPGDLPLPSLPWLHATPHRFLWLPRGRTAILSDVHLGSAAGLAAQGLYVPDASRKLLERSWDALIARNPAHLVIAGDFFDSPRPDDATVDFSAALLARLPDKCSITLTHGNHDPPNLNGLSGCTVTSSLSVGEVHRAIVSHGHQAWEEEAAVWIVGHQHPAVVLATQVQSAKMACYALCDLPGQKKLVILPAFSRAPLGSNLLTGRNWLLPLPRPSNERIHVLGLIEPTVPRDPQVLDFGKLSLIAGP